MDHYTFSKLAFQLNHYSSVKWKINKENQSFQLQMQNQIWSKKNTERKENKEQLH